MNLNVTGPFIYFTIPIFGGIDITQTTVSSLVVTVFLCVMCVALGKNLSTRPGPRQTMVEKGVLMMRDLVVSTMGAHNEHWTPFILTIFLSSLCGSHRHDGLFPLLHRRSELHIGVGADGLRHHLVQQH